MNTIEHNENLKQYLEDHYARSVFDQALNDPSPWVYHLHGGRIVHARLAGHTAYDAVLSVAGQADEPLQKTSVKLLYPESIARAAGKLIKIDPQVQNRKLEPIIAPKDRHHIKNKTLFPLMQQRQVLYFTLLEGEIVRGIVSAFSRYDLTISLKGGLPVFVLRHSVLDVRDKKGRCYLKSSIEPLMHAAGLRGTA
jgi:hypothetical protein